MLFREEGFELWDNFISNKIVYVAEPVERNLESGNCVSCIDWISKWDVGHFYLQLQFVFVGQRNTHQNAILKIRTGREDNISLKPERNVSDSDLPVLVDIGKFVQLPKGMLLKPRPVSVWLKRFDDLESNRRNAADFLGVTLNTGQGAFRLNREAGLSSGFVSREQGQLPCELVESRSESIGELSKQHRDVVRGDFLFDPNVMERILKVVILPDGISVVPEFSDSHLEFVEAFIRSAELHLRINKPNAERHNSAS